MHAQQCRFDIGGYGGPNLTCLHYRDYMLHCVYSPGKSVKEEYAGDSWTEDNGPDPSAVTCRCKKMIYVL